MEKLKFALLMFVIRRSEASGGTCNDEGVARRLKESFGDELVFKNNQEVQTEVLLCCRAGLLNYENGCLKITKEGLQEYENNPFIRFLTKYS